MSLAADTRRAVRQQPFVFDSLRTGVLNYTAAARYLDVGETEPVAVALRRYAESLPDRETRSCEARVTMKAGLTVVDDAETGDALVVVGGSGLVAGGGSLTGILATGAVDAPALGHVLSRLATESIDVEAAGIAGDALVVAVSRRDGPDAVRVVEASLSAVPESVTTPTD